MDLFARKPDLCLCPDVSMIRMRFKIRNVIDE